MDRQQQPPRSRLGVLLLWCAGPLPAQGDERLTVDVTAPESVWQQEPAEVRVTIAWDCEWFAAFGVSLFRQPVDAPCHVELPWLRAAPERAVTLEPVADGASRARVVVGDRVVGGHALEDEVRGGRAFARVELRCRWLGLAAGTARLASVRARYAFATEFRETLLSGRQPVDRQDRSVTSAQCTIEVRALPSPAPAGWTGAVGEFEVEATSGGDRVAVGDHLQVEVTVMGRGNLERFDGLGVVSLDGFHVDGVVERDVEVGRCFVLDLIALRAGAERVPGVPLVTFSPARGEFVTVAGPPVPVLVDPLPDGRELDERVRALVDEDLRRREPAWQKWVLRGGLLLLVLIGAWLSRRALRGRGRRRVDDALHQLRVAALTPGGVAVDAVRVAARFERLLVLFADGGDEFAVPGTWDRLRERGVAPDGMLQLQAVHAQLDAARYGGPLPEAEEILAPAETLAAAAR